MRLLRKLCTINKLMLVTALFFSNTAFSHIISITPTTPFPAQVKASTITRATYTVTNLAKNTSITVIDQSQLPSGMSISATTCGSLMRPSQSCTITLQLQATSGTASVSALLREYASPSADAVQSRINVNVVPGGPLKAYIANFGSNTISICPLNNNGSLNVGACVQQSGSYLLNPSDVLIHPQLQVAYIANQSLLGLATCSVNLDGTFGACSTTRAGGNFDNIIDLAFNKAKTYLYVAGTSTKIYICPINGDGSLGTCTISTGNGTFRTVQGIALNSSGTFAYISSAGNNTISVCPINTDSTFGTCTVFSDPTLGFNQGVSFNANETYAYIPNGDSRSTVSICPVNQATGTLSACTSTNGNGTFSMSGFAGNLSMGSTQNIGYIPNDTSNTISLCTINQTTGALSNCTAVSSSGFNTSCSIGFY